MFLFQRTNNWNHLNQLQSSRQHLPTPTARRVESDGKIQPFDGIYRGKKGGLNTAMFVYLRVCWINTNSKSGDDSGWYLSFLWQGWTGVASFRCCGNGGWWLQLWKTTWKVSLIWRGCITYLGKLLSFLNLNSRGLGVGDPLTNHLGWPRLRSEKICPNIFAIIFACAKW